MVIYIDGTRFHHSDTMTGLRVLLLLAAAFLALAEGSALKRHPKALPGEEDWGYIEVRPGARMFYWLYYSTAAPDPATLPVVFWLQGGPGASSTGIGNFEIMGPLDVNLEPRNSSWVHHVNVVYIDNPVGTGYSHVDNLNLLTTTNKEIADDLVTFTKAFYTSHPEFETAPLAIFGESYGGKMDVEFALELDAAIKNSELSANLVAVAIGDGWVSPIDSTTTWAPYLWHIGVVDTEGYNRIDNKAQECQLAVDEGRWDDATQLWSDTEVAVMIASHNVDFYNILYRTQPLFTQRKARNAREEAYLRNVAPRDALTDLMNGPIRDKLMTTTPDLEIWDEQGGDVFNALWTDFMKPATQIVELLLNTTTIDVVVYNGQLDLIVDTPGQVQWVERLNWPSKPQYMAANREALTINGYTEGYLKEFDHMKFWWIDRAGHMVPTDNPNMGIKMVRQVTGLPPVN